MMKILISQPRPINSKSPYFDLERDYGVQIDFKPFFTVEPISVRAFRDQKINILDHTAVVLTSRSVVNYFFDMVGQLRLTMPADMTFFCGSEAVATYLQKYIVYRKRKIFFAPTGKREELVDLILKHSKEKFLIPSSKDAKEELTQEMDKKKISYTTAVLYETVYQSFTPEELKSYDLLVFFSPNGIASLFENDPEYRQGSQLIATFGERTAKALEARGLKLSIGAPTAEFSSMSAALEQLIKQQKEKA